MPRGAPAHEQIIRGGAECSRMERGPWGAIFPCNSTSPTQPNGQRSSQKGVGRKQHSHPTTEQEDL